MSAPRCEIDRTLLRDPALQPIAAKVSAGDRLSPEEGAYLFRTPDLLGVGVMANAVNRARHGDRIYFAANQHINPTNVCILRKTCVFCSYARLCGAVQESAGKRTGVGNRRFRWQDPDSHQRGRRRFRAAG